MRIVFIETTEKTRPGLTRLSKSLAEDGHEVCVLLPEKARENLDRVERIDYRFYSATTVPGVRYTLVSRSFYRTYRDALTDADVVHIFSYFYPPCTLAAVIADRNDTNCIVTIDSLPGINWSYGNRIVDCIGSIYTHTLGRLTFNAADRVTLLGDYLRSDVSRFTSTQKVETIPNGIDTSTYVPAERSRRSDADVELLYVGRLDTVKGIPLLLEGIRVLDGKRDADVRLTIVGDGTKRAEYEEYCSTLGIRDIVTFEGHVDDTVEYYNSHDVLVLPSVSEGQPNVVMEAQACGVPVVSTDVGSVNEMIAVGRVIDSREPRDLAAAITSVVESDDGSRAEAARSHIESRYSIEKVCEEYLDLYERVA